MKQVFFSLIVLAAAPAAFAQSSSAVAVPAPAAAAASASSGAADSITATAPKASPISIKYVGIYEGPNLTADGNNMHGEDTYVSNRPQLTANISDNFKAGIQARVSTIFTKDGLKAQNETWRLFGNFKNVASYGIVSLDLIPRLMLPTSKSNHNKTMTVSPELLAAFNISPANSRFSFAYTPQMLKYFYSDTAMANTKNFASFILLHNIEGTYQLGATTQLTFGFYPEMDYLKNTTGPAINSSNEIDVGLNIDVAKGWSLSPYVGFEPVGADSENYWKSMEAALVVSGTFL